MEKDPGSTIEVNTIYKNGHHKIVATRHGTMLINTNDIFIGRCLDIYGEWSIEEIIKTARYANGVVLDIGANIGTHTLSYAKYADHVLSFETQPIIYNMLCANIMLNSIGNVFPARIAISNTESITKIPDIDFLNPGNFGACSINDGMTGTAIAKTIDYYEPRHVSLIKIDVEGHEMEVLEGARKTIRKNKPCIYLENDRPDKQDELCQYIRSIGYTFEWHIVPLYNENNYNGYKTDLFPGISSINMICLPE